MSRAVDIREGIRDFRLRDAGQHIDNTVERVRTAKDNAMRRATGLLAAGAAGYMAYNSLKHGTITGAEQLPYSRKGSL